RDVARLFEIGEGRIHDAGRRRVPTRGLLLQHLDDLVAVARLLRDQGERDQPQIAGREHAAGADHVAAATHAVASAKAEAAMASPGAAAGPTLLAVGVMMSHAKHGSVFSVLKDIS